MLNTFNNQRKRQTPRKKGVTNKDDKCAKVFKENAAKYFGGKSAKICHLKNCQPAWWVRIEYSAILTKKSMVHVQIKSMNR